MQLQTLLIGTGLLAAVATAAAGPAFEVTATRISGGGSSAGETFALTGSIGQPEAGAMLESSGFALVAGFWAAAPGDNTPCPADLNGDNFVDAGDLATILAAWGDCAPDCPEDLDQSGAVDAGDLATLLAAWGGCG